MSIALEARVRELEAKFSEMLLALRAAEEWILAMRECGYEPPVSSSGLPNATRRKPGPKPKESNG